MLRSIATPSSLGFFKSLLQPRYVRIISIPVPSWRSCARSYCKDSNNNDNNNTTKPTAVDKQTIISNVPHTVLDADADLQVDLAGELDLRLPITNEPRKYIEFECAVCNTNVKKTCSTHSYEKGVVLIKCPGCAKLPDHLGFTGYEGERTIEQIAEKLGISVKRTRD